MANKHSSNEPEKIGGGSAEAQAVSNAAGERMSKDIQIRPAAEQPANIPGRIAPTYQEPEDLLNNTKISTPNAGARTDVINIPNKPGSGGNEVSPSYADTPYSGFKSLQAEVKRVDPGLKSTTDGNAPSTMLPKTIGPQSAEVGSAGSARTTESKITPSEVRSGPSQTEVKAGPVVASGESRGISTVPEVDSSNRPVPAQPIESVPQNKSATQRDVASNSDSAGAHKGDSSAAGGSTNTPGRKDEGSSSNTPNRPAVAESSTRNATSNTVRAEVRPEVKSGVEGSTAVPTGQLRGESKVEPASSLPTSAQQKFDTQRAESSPVGQGKSDFVRNSEFINTQGSTNPPAKVEGLRVPEAKLDTGKPVEQQGSKDTSTFRDPPVWQMKF